jgi:hypothetical protein
MILFAAVAGVWPDIPMEPAIGRDLWATVLHQPLVEPDDVKWRLASQCAATVLNCAVRPFICSD